MAVNRYLKHLSFGNVSEQNLVDDLIVESIKIHGMDVFYIPRTAQKMDDIFGEDILSRFQDKFEIEMYFQSVGGFDGGNFLSKFGLEIRKQATFVVSKTRFNQILQTDANLEVRPKNGDLIFMPLTRDLFEIIGVTHESIFHQLGKVYVWALTVEKFAYSSEDINTGIPEIDTIDDLNSMVLGPSFEIEITNAGWAYTVAPTVTISGGGGSGATAISTINLSGQVTGVSIVTSGTGYVSAPTITFTNNVADTTGHGASAIARLISATEPAYDNSEVIQEESDDVVDFSEKDPFSMGGKY